jgi:hypothetical protein
METESSVRLAYITSDICKDIASFAYSPKFEYNINSGYDKKKEETKSEEEKATIEKEKQDVLGKLSTFQKDILPTMLCRQVDKICDLFKYAAGTCKTEVVPLDQKLISATTYNDYYKFTMAPVIGAVEDHQESSNMTNHITFAVDLREPKIAEAMLNGNNEYHTKLANNLNNLKDRMFNRDILVKLNAKHAPFKSIYASYWNNGKNADKIFGKSDTPNTLLGTPETDVDRLRQYIQRNGNIKKYNETTGQMSQERSIIDTDFRGDTIVLDGQFVPNKTCDIVVLSMYVGPDAKSGAGKTKLHIEANGKWRNVSWLETSMMQTVYETAHTQDLIARDISYGQWLAEALFRTYLGRQYLETNPDAKDIKVALFSGRRTGGFLYNLLQVFLWSKFSKPFPAGRNLGTSSVDAWYQLNKLGMTGIVAPAGTHAHELSMVLSSIYADLDKNGKNLVLTQVLGHYLYYKLTHQSSPAPMPMLPDTLGTESFLRAANVIKILSNDKTSFKSLLEMIGSARQDSGTLENFKKLMETYDYKGGMMASEIDNITDFDEAQRLGYGLAGVGGALGDSEKAWNTTGGRTFNASMAVKAVRVFFDGKSNENSFPVKTGDGDDVKVTADTTLPIDEYKELVRIANETRDANKDKSEPKQKLVHNPVDHNELNKKFRIIAQAIIKHSSLNLTYNESEHYNAYVDSSNGELTEYARVQMSGGRRMKSNMRQINKTLSKYRNTNNSTKSIRKNRRSYRKY